jgi:hypothetical protein
MSMKSEKYKSKAAMKKHEGMETPGKKKQESSMMKKPKKKK